MTSPIRNRIKSHRRVRAGDLVPHEWNFRLHPEDQKAALQAIYQEVGFARSLLAYELTDGRLKLLDGHLRRDLDPDMEVDVEILDVTEDEARQLLLTIDPLASLAQQEEIRARLLEITPHLVARPPGRLASRCRQAFPGPGGLGRPPATKRFPSSSSSSSLAVMRSI